MLLSHAPTVLAATSSKGGSGIVGFLPFLALILLGYFLLIRPARNRQRKALELRSAVSPGARVTTTAGLIATVVAVEDDAVVLEIAPGVQARFIKGAIARIDDPGETGEYAEPGTDAAAPAAPGTEAPAPAVAEADTTER